MTELSASAITSDALTMLRAQGARVRRVNNIPHNKRYANQVDKGYGDIQGFSCTGKVIICEVKKLGDKLSVDQKNLLLDVDKCGGIALVATQEGYKTMLFTITAYLKLKQIKGGKEL